MLRVNSIILKVQQIAIIFTAFAAALLLPFVAHAEEQSQSSDLKETQVEVSYINIDSDADSENQDGMSFSLRNETYDGWYIDIDAIDADFQYENDDNSVTSVDNVIEAHMGKTVPFSDNLNVYGGVGYSYLTADGDKSGDLGFEVGAVYQVTPSLDVRAEVAYKDWGDDNFVEMTVGSYMQALEHLDVFLRAKRLGVLDVTMYEGGVNFNF